MPDADGGFCRIVLNRFWPTGVLLVYLIVSLPVLGIFLWLRVYDHHHGILFLLWLYVFWRSMAAFVLLDAATRAPTVAAASNGRP